MGPPTLTTGRLVLRPFRPEDAPTVERLAGAREVADTTMHIPHPYPAGGAADWIGTHASAWDEKSHATWAITDKTSGEVLGAIALTLRMPHDHGELGYWLGVPFWNQGFATEAARAVLAFAFGELKLHRVQARHFVRNPSSGRVMQKLGMRLEGTHRHAAKRWDRYEDTALYAILAPEWRTLSAT